MPHYQINLADPGSLTLGPGRFESLEEAVARAESLVGVGGITRVEVVAVDEGRQEVVYDTVDGHQAPPPGPLFPEGAPARERPSGLAEGA